MEGWVLSSSRKSDEALSSIAWLGVGVGVRGGVRVRVGAKVRHRLARLGTAQDK